MARSLFAAVLALLVVSSTYGWGVQRFGAKPVSGAEYGEWPNVLLVINDSHRVYQSWVNGQMHSYFRGDSQALNLALKNFAKIDADRLTILIRPGPGVGNSFNNEKSFKFNWQLHLLGGVSQEMANRELGSNIWDPNPSLHVYVDEAIKLDEIQIPKGIHLLEIADLKKRYVECLASDDSAVRGWSCGYIARLDPYDSNSMRKIARKLEDEDNWVRRNAAGALSVYSHFADEAILKLRTVKTDDQQLQKRILKSIELLERTQPDDAARKRFQQSSEAVHHFVVAQRQISQILTPMGNFRYTNSSPSVATSPQPSP